MVPVSTAGTFSNRARQLQRTLCVALQYRQEEKSVQEHLKKGKTVG